MPLTNMFKAKGLKRRWLVNNLGLVALILLVFVAVFCITAYNFYYTNLTSQLIARADTTALFLQTYQSSDPTLFFENTRRYAEEFVDRDKMEFQVIQRNERVRYSSSDGLFSGFDPGTPDVATALKQQKTTSYAGEDSFTKERVLSVTAPLYFPNGELAGAVRMITGLRNVDQIILTLCLISIFVAVSIFGFVLFTNSYFLRSILNPVREINEITKQIAAGEYGGTIEKKFDDEIGELADSINFMSSEIGKSEMLKNDFISSVSHELRTPLTAITGWAETLQQQSSFEKDSLEQRGLAVIARESQNLRQMVEELLDFSRIQSGRMVINKTPIDIAAELEDSMFSFEQRLRQDGLYVTYENRMGDDVIIQGDRARLHQVFINILDNARKYSLPGGTIDLSISLDQAAGMVEIRITDHGVGIAPDDLPHIKQKFYKGKSRQPGSGIGLAVCDEIVMLHNGTLTLESKVGEGTTAIIRLPLR